MIEPNDNEQRSNGRTRSTRAGLIRNRFQRRRRGSRGQIKLGFAKEQLNVPFFLLSGFASESPGTRFRSRTFPPVTQTTGMKKMKEA